MAGGCEATTIDIDPPTLLRVAGLMRGLQVARLVGAAAGSRQDVVDDGRVGQVGEGFTAECARRRVGDDGRAKVAVATVAGDLGYGM